MKYPKAILFSLFFVFFLAKCSERPYVKQPALSCEISYDGTKFNELRKNSLISVYDFDNNSNMYLSYKEQSERGVIYLGKNPIQRLKIPKAKFSELAKIKNGESSIDQLEDNKQHSLQSPLFIVAQYSDGKHVLYKMGSLLKRKPSTIEKAEENSDAEQQMKNKFVTAGALGFSGGLIIGGMAATFVLLFYKLK